MNLYGPQETDMTLYEIKESCMITIQNLDISLHRKNHNEIKNLFLGSLLFGI